MHALHKRPHRARLLLISLSGAFALSIVAAPLFAGHSHPLLGALLYLIFSPVCHQLPQRSFVLQGYSWAVCHRCAGIYFGLFAGSFLPARWWVCSLPTRRRRQLVLAAATPLLLDVILPYAGLWTNTAGSRFISGFLFGGAMMALLLPGIAEFLSTIRSRPPAPSGSSQPEGGI
jgi:uncharacterized membrane protein